MSSRALIEAAEKTLERTREQLKEAEGVSASAQKAWVEAESAVSALRRDVQSVENALQALKGEQITPDKPAEAAEKPKDDLIDLSPEEFEKELERKRRQKEKEKRESGPYAGIQCKNCGEVGTLYDSTQVIRGKPVAIIACEKCTSTSFR